MKPLSGIVVADFTQILAGPLCTQYLGDLGAEVIKVEPYEIGDDGRQWPPLHGGVGAAFLSVNRNKRSLGLDLKSPDSRAIVERLIKKADIMIESSSYGVAERLGIDYETAKSINPQIIYCSISGYGRTGPLKEIRGYDLALQAFSGMLELTGHPGGGPTRIPLSPIDQGTGMHALSGVLAALVKRLKTGEGSYLEVSLFETAVGYLGFYLERFWTRGHLPPKSGTEHESLCPYSVYQAADGPVLLAIANNNSWHKFCTLTGRPDLIDDPRFVTNAQRAQNRQITNQTVQEIFSTRTRAEWIELLQKGGVPISSVNTMADLLDEPHTKERGIIMDYVHPDIGDAKSIAHPVKFADETRKVDRPPPRHGEHTVEILEELGFSGDDIDALRSRRVVAVYDDKKN